MGTGADRKVLKYHYKHHEYIGQHPKDRKTGWCDNLNGVAHDNDYWYFTQAAGLTTDDTLWKFPVTYDLNNGPEGTVAKCGIPEELADRFYHFGALDCYDGYLFVPVYKKDDPERIEVFLIAGVLVFKAENLEYIGEAPLMGYSPGFPPQTGAPWCAVNPQDGLLYSCNNNIKLASPFVFRYKYQINEQDRKVTLTPQEPFRLFLVQDLNYMQGGAFSTSGELYLMNGFESDFKPEDGGISLFDGDGRIIGRSHQGGSFRFEFHPGTIQREEPEGLTYWDLDTDGRAPNIGGQVHAIMLDNESLSEDDLYFKHYRVSQRPFPVYVHHEYAGDYPGWLKAQWLGDIRGIAHGEADWFFAEKRRLWKIPVMQDISAGTSIATRYVDLPDELLDYECFEGFEQYQGFLFVPVSGQGKIPRLAVFRADDLSYVTSSLMDQPEVTWCAISPLDDSLLSSGKRIYYPSSAYSASESEPVARYKIDFDALHNRGELRLEFKEVFLLREKENDPMEIYDVKGAISSESGYLYLGHKGGIKVFDTEGNLVDRSSNKGCSFADNGAVKRPISACGCRAITVWNLNRKGVTGISGDIHTIFDYRADSGNEYCFRHFAITEPPFVGNRSSKEVHECHCAWAKKLAIINRVPFKDFRDAIGAGYDGCGHCLHVYDTR